MIGPTNIAGLLIGIDEERNCVRVMDKNKSYCGSTINTPEALDDLIAVLSKVRNYVFGPRASPQELV